ncbi:hypothetical protein RZS08_08835, partial [Arthrospira platensis SPKY1]|nr:hypothetical protein [Arthrospira platensis SPKY1]
DALEAGYQGLVGEGGIYGYLGVGHDVIDLFLADMQYVVTQIIEAAMLFTEEGLTQANAMSTTMKAVGNAIEAGVGGLIKPQGGSAGTVTIADYAGVAHDIFDLFIADMVYVVAIVEAAALEFTEKGIVQATKFAQAGDQIFKAIQDGVKAATAVGGLTPTGLQNAMQLITTSVVDAVTDIAAGFRQLVTRAYHFGYDWISNIIAGLRDRLPDLVALLD